MALPPVWRVDLHPCLSSFRAPYERPTYKHMHLVGVLDGHAEWDAWEGGRHAFHLHGTQYQHGVGASVLVSGRSRILPAGVPRNARTPTLQGNQQLCGRDAHATFGRRGYLPCSCTWAHPPWTRGAAVPRLAYPLLQMSGSSFSSNPC